MEVGRWTGGQGEEAPASTSLSCAYPHVHLPVQSARNCSSVAATAAHSACWSCLPELPTHPGNHVEVPLYLSAQGSTASTPSLPANLKPKAGNTNLFSLLPRSHAHHPGRWWSVMHSRVTRLKQSLSLHTVKTWTVSRAVCVLPSSPASAANPRLDQPVMQLQGKITNYHYRLRHPHKAWHGEIIRSASTQMCSGPRSN